MWNGYWTIFSSAQPIMSFASFELAWRMVGEILLEAKRAESY